MTAPRDFQPAPQDLQGTRQAASLLLLRDSPAGPEVLMLRRAERADDLRSGVWVFPGGVLDPVDVRLHARVTGADDAALSEDMGLAAGALDYVVAAIRESFEEVGVLLAGPGEAAQRAAQERDGCITGADFEALCQRHDLQLQGDALVYYSHWLTPPGIPKRFDTRFFVARMPGGQAAVADRGEAQEVAWFTPAAALESELKLLPVTRRTLMDLARAPDVDSVLDLARRQPPERCMMPRLGLGPKGVRPVLPDEWAWAEIGRLDPTGQGDVALDLQPLRAVPLSPRVTRLTCANGSVMTGPGTNTYLVRSPGSMEVAVIDPGPDDAHTEAHLQAVLAAAAPGRITRIFVTHTHKDHSPAAQRLRALTGAPVIGRVADHPEWQDATMQPDHVPANGEWFELGPDAHLQAVATPGHASNHVCWLLPQEQLLFTGDHVMQGSTVVINPPDGDMGAYFRSLEAMLALDLDWLAPGHGFLMPEPHAEVHRLLAHRRVREAKVMAALAAIGPATAEQLVPEVYGDVPVARHALAARSLTAHLLKLAAEGRAVRGDAEAIWQVVA
ncbi:MBL fold metallo-hydrolase [Ideonella margarita]|uniref:MBL fold metallo-hydrolase n=1 Tax=Ideonella margarita TaxID=2984191 RepID=A0ABU9C2F8_9BURK